MYRLGSAIPRRFDLRSARRTADLVWETYGIQQNWSRDRWMTCDGLEEVGAARCRDLEHLDALSSSGNRFCLDDDDQASSCGLLVDETTRGEGKRASEREREEGESRRGKRIKTRNSEANPRTSRRD